MKLSKFFTHNLKRDADVVLTHFSHNNTPGTVCFALNETYITQANKNENVVAIITYSKYQDIVALDKGLILSENPKKAFYELHNFMFLHGYMTLSVKDQIDASAHIASTAIIEENVSIGKNVVISDYTIIKSQTIIEDNAYVGSHCIIGAKGLNNTRIDNGFVHVEDAGGVYIGQNCEILDATIIQKSIYKEMTSIKEQSKISVNVNIGHGTQIGKRTLVAGKVQIAGYVEIGDDVWIGPSSVISHNLKIFDNAEIKIGSVVIKNVKKDSAVSGNFAYTHQKHLKNIIKAQR